MFNPVKPYHNYAFICYTHTKQYRRMRPMRDVEYSNWLQQHVTSAAITNYIKRCQRVEDNLKIDLDDEYRKDSGISLLDKLTYTTDDELQNRPLRCSIFFNTGSNLRNGMGSLKTAVSKYFEFCQNNTQHIQIKPCITPAVIENNEPISPTVIDSYQEFLNRFSIDKESFYQWGISATIFPNITAASAAWTNLKKRILNNQTVYIRGYGRDAHGTQLYKDLYSTLFNNSHVEKDPTNNAIPHRHIQQLTGLKRNYNVYNYQVSHIWGHTKNIFLFEAPWNICYTPKIIDPFTGHETQGVWPTEYQQLFISHAYNLYKHFVDEYNQLLIDYDIPVRLKEYLNSLRGTISDKEFTQFVKDANSELSPIIL